MIYICKRLLVIMTALLAITIKAQAKNVVIETTFGERMVCQFSENPKLSPDKEFVLLATTRLTVQYRAKDISKVYIADRETSDVDASTIKGGIVVEEDIVQIKGLNANEPTSIYALAGKIQKTYHASQDGELTILLSELKAGIYIIKTNKQSIKVTKR